MQHQWMKLKASKNYKQPPNNGLHAQLYLAAAQQSAQASLQKALQDLRKEATLDVEGSAATSSDICR